MGTLVKKVSMPKNHCMVSVGGGFVEISEYYKKESYGQSVALYRTIKSKNSTFKDILISLLEKREAQKTLAFFNK